MALSVNEWLSFEVIDEVECILLFYNLKTVLSAGKQ